MCAIVVTFLYVEGTGGDFSVCSNSNQTLNGCCSRILLSYTVFDLIGARGTYVNLFTTSAKRSLSGR